MASLSTALHNGFLHIFYLERFCQMCSHAGCETSFGIFLKCICSHCNDRNCFCICPVHGTYGFCCCNTIHNRHHDIHQYGIKGSRRIIFEVLHRLSAVFATVTFAPSSVSSISMISALSSLSSAASRCNPRISYFSAISSSFSVPGQSQME